jgi:hypothetical protein
LANHKKYFKDWFNHDIMLVSNPFFFITISLALSLPLFIPLLMVSADVNTEPAATEGGNATDNGTNAFVQNSNIVTSPSLTNSNLNTSTLKETAIINDVMSNQTVAFSPLPKEEPTGPPIGLVSGGTINSLINTPTTKWIATGNWSINVINGTMKFFATNMTWYNSNGTAAHSHEFLNFAGDKGRVISLQQPSNNVNIKGIMDVGTNNRVVWKAVPSTIEINGKKTITISVDDNATNHHFAAQHILGVVKTFVLCSDIPGPDMQVLPPCTSTIPETPNVSSASTSANNTNAGFESTPTLQSPSVPANVPEEQSRTVSPTVSNENNGNLPFQIYENATYGIKISYPPDWIFQRGRTVNPSLDIAAKISPSSDSITDFTIGIRKLGADVVTIKEYANNTLNTYKKQVRNFQPTLVNTNGKLAGNPAYEIDGTYLDEQSIKHQIFEVGTILNNKAYILQFDSDESKTQGYMPDLKVMIPSFQVLASASSNDGSSDNLDKTSNNSDHDHGGNKKTDGSHNNKKSSHSHKDNCDHSNNNDNSNSNGNCDNNCSSNNNDNCSKDSTNDNSNNNIDHSENNDNNNDGGNGDGTNGTSGP